jgi:phosphoribosyl 1,2-cyclic phosphate phosphodiesterase
VVITHVHFDHCAGLDNLIHYRESLPVYAADGTGLTVPEPNAGASVAAVLDEQFGYAETLSIRARTPCESFEACGLEVTLVPVDHGQMACYGVCVVDPVSETKLAITSDTSYAIGERSRTTFSDSDLLIAESLVPASVEGEWPTDRPGKRVKPTWNHPDAEGTPRNLRGSHLTHEGALALADDVGPKRVRLVHASQYYPADRAFDDPLARDGERWEL